jgi:lysophospholipase L1-like esterase
MGIDKFALPMLYPQALLVGNGGVSGDTTANMLLRDGNASSSSRKAITDILALRPDVVLLRGGSINDLTGLTSGQVAGQVATTTRTTSRSSTACGRAAFM